MENNQEPLSISETVNEIIAQRGGNARALSALFDGLEANLTFWDMSAKKMVTVPDHKTRERCATRLLEYAVGKPVERKEVLTKTVTADSDLIERAKASPAMQKALRDFLTKISEPNIVELKTPA